jgi:hypothetical protein
MRNVKIILITIVMIFFIMRVNAKAELVCDEISCQGAMIQSILIGWGGETVKVRFEVLKNLTCDYKLPNQSTSSFNEIRLDTSDSQFPLKFNALMSAHLASRPIWFYTKKGPADICLFDAVIIMK